MVDRTRIGMMWLAVVLSIFVMLGYTAPIVAMGGHDDDGDGGMGDDEGGMGDGDGGHEGPCHTHEEVIDTATSDSTVQHCTQNYSQTDETAYYSDTDEDEWHVEIVNTSSTEMESPDKTAVVIDDRTGEIKIIAKYIAPTISDDDAIDIAKGNAGMGNFLSSHPRSRVWACYHGTHGKWVARAHDVETLEESTVLIDDNTGEVTINTPSLDWAQLIYTAKSRPTVDNFLALYGEESRVSVRYDDVLDQWIVSFVYEEEDSVTVHIDDTSGGVMKVQMFSWKAAVEKFEEVMG